MKLPLKIIFIIAIGILSIIALGAFNSFAYNYFTQRQTITNAIDDLEKSQRDLDYLILESEKSSYINHDSFNEKINTVNTNINILQKNIHLMEVHPKSVEILNNYQVEFDRKVQHIYDFQTHSSVIKNSTLAIPTLTQKSHSIFDLSNTQEARFLSIASQASLLVLEEEHTVDANLLNKLEENIVQLEKISFASPKKEELRTALILNLHIFRNNFSHYLETFEAIRSSQTSQILQKMREVFNDENIAESQSIIYFSVFLVFLYILSIALILYFLIRSERAIRTDRLTNLQNRKAFEMHSKYSDSLTLVLININKFKNFNDFYGVAFGDQILIETAKRLSAMVATEKKAKLFRIGGDEFGIVCITHTLLEIEAMAKNMADTFQETSMFVDNIEVSINISVAISAQTPLLETADMTLKELKKYHSKNVLLYSDDLHLFEHIQTNVVKTHILEHAIKNNKIFPHFQPIISLQTGKIEKYESLARLQLDNGEVQSIVGYLDILKESKHASTLTHIMIQKSCEIMQSKECQFSINLSINDIGNPSTIAVILEIFTLYPSMSNRIIFEILENEAVDDYQQLSRFIKEMKSYGCKIAIDDFGSGYSNFAHILNLDIDILKLDGSLIRNLNVNDHTAMIVETIVAFAKQAGIATVAEFVCDIAIYNAVKQLGIDYAQGYYTGKPEPLD
jgi:diguanylate cyclase (GGDEF)-like protein